MASSLPKSNKICYNYQMKFSWKIVTASLLIFAGFLGMTSGSPIRATHAEADALITLDRLPTASIMEVGTRYANNKLFVSKIYEADYAFQLLGLNWEQALPEGTGAALEIRFLSEEGEWTDWQPLAADEDQPSYADDELWTYVITENSEAFQYRVYLSTENNSVAPKLSNVSFDYVDGGKTSALTQLQRLIFKDDSEVLSREDWGADEELLLARNYNVDANAEWESETTDVEIVDTLYVDENGDKLLWPQEYPEEVEKIIIHHTATTENLDDPEVAIRAIYYYHAVSRGWGDIGYNFIVAPDGTIYEGRAGGDGVVAGHASGYNTGSVGIALLGNYEEEAIPEDMMQGLTALIYEKAQLHDIDPDGTSEFRGEVSPNILGHRDVDSTACPGEHAYDYLPEVRSLVAKAVEQEEQEGDEDYAYEEVTDRELVVLDPGDKAGISVKIENTGSKTWTSSTYLLVEGEDESEDIISISKDSKNRVASMKESSVKPGSTATFAFSAEATDEGGLAEFEMIPVFNGSEESEQFMALGFYVDAPKSTKSSDESDSSSDDASVTEVLTDLNFEAGETKVVGLKIKNTSKDTWSSTGDDAFTLAFSGENGLSAVFSRATFKSLGAGASTKVYFKVTAPDEAGTYTLEVRPRLGSTNLTTKAYELDITVSSSDFEETEYENPIRIKLTPDEGVGEPVITSETTFALYDDEELIKTFSANSRVRVIDDEGSYTVTSGSLKWTLDGPVRLIPEEDGIMKILTMNQRATWDSSINDNEFRGTIEVNRVDEVAVLINELPLEEYLMGLAEETNDTPTEKLRTMAILGRSYAYYYITQAEKFPGMPYDGEDDPNTFQKYLGYGYESRHPNVAQAVKDTEDLVVTYEGDPVKTPYFSQSDGVATKSAKEVWGWTDTPWLKSVPDPYCDSSAFSGHGVGLSGCGAKTLAEEGWTFEEIIKYYYTGVEVSSIE